MFQYGVIWECRSPFANTAQAGRLFGWRFAIHVEDLEYKMSNLAPSEEQLITGNAMASWSIGDSPTVGDVLTFTITDANDLAPITYTVTDADLHPTENIVNPSEASPTFSIALNAAQAINNAASRYGYAAVAAMPADLFSPQYMPPYFAEVILTAPGSSPTFSIGASVDGMTNLLVEQQAAPSPIAATLGTTAYYGYVALLDALAMSMSQANLSLIYQTADVVNFRPDEVRARRQLYRQYCELLSRDLGGKEYVEHFFGGGSGGVVA